MRGLPGLLCPRRHAPLSGFALGIMLTSSITYEARLPATRCYGKRLMCVVLLRRFNGLGVCYATGRYSMRVHVCVLQRNHTQPLTLSVLVSTSSISAS